MLSGEIRWLGQYTGILETEPECIPSTTGPEVQQTVRGTHAIASERYHLLENFTLHTVEVNTAHLQTCARFQCEHTIPDVS